jgi:hypothetical protein
VGDYESDK